MARIQRLYRVRATYPNGEEVTRHYQTPKAADERRRVFEAGRPKMLNEVELALRMGACERAGIEYEPELEVPTVVVTPSHPVTYPHPAGDLGKLETPDSYISHERWVELGAWLGISPFSIISVGWSEAELVVTYQPDSTGKAEPKIWRIEVDG